MRKAVPTDGPHWLHQLANPPAGFAVMPLWAWCGNLWEEEITRQLASFSEQGCRRIMIFPTSGAMGIRFMSDDWLDRIEFTVERAAGMDMDIILYDDLDWPSGIAGGQVTERHEFAQKILSLVSLRRGDVYNPAKGELVWKAVGLRRRGEQIDLDSLSEVDATGNARDYMPPDRDQCIVLVQRPTRESTFYGPFLDVLNPEAVESFLDHVHRRYEKRLSAHFGKTIKGFFLDEPFWSPVNLGSAALQTEEFLPWTERLPEYFRDLGLADLVPALLAACFDVGPRTRELRIRFWKTLNRHYHRSYWERIGSWCRQRDLLLTGHGNESSFAGQIYYGGDPGLNLLALNPPGIDLVGTDFEKRDTVYLHQPKVVNAIARWTGSARPTCETFACMSYAATLHDARQETDWLFALGVNAIAPITPRFALIERMKSWSAGPFTFQEPAWSWTGGYVRMMDRQAYAITSGQRACSVALLYPLENALGEYRSAVTAEHLRQPWDKDQNTAFDRVDRGFRKLLKTLLAIPVDCDLLYAFMFEEATVRDGRLRVRDAAYDLVILPPGDILPQAVLRVLASWQKQGGAVLTVGFSPAFLLTDDERLVPLEAGTFPVTDALPYDPDGGLEKQADGLERIISGRITRDLVIKNKAREDRVFYHHRQIGPVDLYFIANQSRKALDLDLGFPNGRHAYLFDAETGRIHALASESLSTGGLALRCHFPERYSEIFLLSPEPLPSEYLASGKPLLDWSASDAQQAVALENTWEFEPLGENILPFADCSLIQRWEKSDFGLQLYRASFSVRSVPARVALAFEPFDQRRIQPAGEFRNTYTVRVNGLETGPVRRQESFDRNHAEVEVASLLRPGTNTVELAYRFCTWLGQIYVHSLYLSGDFVLQGKEISAGLPPKCHLESWARFGFPYYSGRIRYRTRFASPRKGQRVLLDLGVVRQAARVVVNGFDCGTRLWPPYCFEITDSVSSSGDNELTVEVANTLANRIYQEPAESGLLGPVSLVIG